MDMEQAAYEALDEHRPFSSVQTRMVRYWGEDRKINRMAMNQMQEIIRVQLSQDKEVVAGGKK